MSFNFTVKEFLLGNGNGTPTLQFYKRGFNLGGSGSQPSWQDIILSGNTALTLTNALANGLNYVKLFGNTEQRNLPSEYTQVEYIESDGTQYIDTGITDITNSEFEVVAQQTSITGAFPTIMGALDEDSNYKIVCGLSTSNNTFYSQCGGAMGYIVSSVPNDTQKHTFKVTTTTNQQTLQVDDTAVVIGNYAITSTTGYSLTICARNKVTISNFTSQKVFSVRIKKSGTLIQNLIPCRRNSDNVLGMYDTVTGNFLTNQGTGDFTAGTDVVPSPDTPVDIVCNNGVVKAFKTLNISTYDTSASDAGIDITFDGVTDRRRWNTLNDGGTGTRHYENGFVSIYMSPNGNTYYVKALVNGVVYDGSVYNTGEQIYNWNYNIDKNIDIYCPTINTDGTTETVEVHTKNLISTASQYVLLGQYTDASGNVVNSKVNFQTKKFPCKPNTTYTASISDSVTMLRICVYNSSGTFVQRYNTQVGDGVKTTTFTTGASVTQFNIGAQISASDTTQTMINAINWQIEQGSTATDYEPYFNGGSASAEMLLQVGDYKDEQSVIDGGVTRQIGIKVLDGTETWNVATNEHNGVNRNNFYTMFDDATATGTDFIICSIAPWAQTAVKDYSAPACRISGSKNFNIVPFEDTTTIPNVASWTQYLAEQYASGTPVIVVYPLAEPTTETVTAQPLTTQAGTNIVEITESSIDDLGLEVSYKATV